MKVYKDVVLPTLLYASETWVTYRHNLMCLEKFHNRSIRRILGIKWQDKRTTNSVFEEANTTSIEAMIHVVRTQLRWSGHVQRMREHRLPQKIMYSELESGKRRQGGQRKRLKIPCTNASSSASSVQRLGNNKPRIEVDGEPPSTVVLLFLKTKDG